MNSSTRQLLKCAIVVMIMAFVLVRYARAIPCTWCREPYGVCDRDVGGLCRSCAKVFDRNARRVVRRRSVLRRIFRTAA